MIIRAHVQFPYIVQDFRVILHWQEKLGFFFWKDLPQGTRLLSLTEEQRDWFAKHFPEAQIIDASYHKDGSPVT